MFMPVVSIVIPTYNCAHYITEAIQSVLQQTYKDIEIIVVDDGSTDNTKEILELYIGKGIIKYIYQNNQGPGAARNSGIRASRGDFIAFLDADDALTLDSLEKRLRLMESVSLLDLIFSDFYMEEDFVQTFKIGFLKKEKFLRKFSKSIEYTIQAGIVFRKDLYRNFFRTPLFICTDTVLARKSLFSRTGLFKTDIYAGEDTGMWLRMVMHGRVGYIDSPLAYYKNLRSSLTKESIEYVKNRQKFYCSLLEEFKEDKKFTRTIQRRLGWVYFDFGKFYHRQNQGLIAKKNFLKSIYYNPKNTLFYKFFISSILPLRLRLFLKNLLKKSSY